MSTPGAALLDLPDELIVDIVSNIQGRSRTRTLAALCLTCRRLCRIADATLYQRPQMQIGNEDLLTRTLKKRRECKDQILDVGNGCAMTIWFTEERPTKESAWDEAQRNAKRRVLSARPLYPRVSLSPARYAESE